MLTRHTVRTFTKYLPDIQIKFYVHCFIISWQKCVSKNQQHTAYYHYATTTTSITLNVNRHALKIRGSIKYIEGMACVCLPARTDNGKKESL